MRLRAAAGVLVALLALAAPAAAHGGGAVFEVLEASEVAPGRIALRVLVTHGADGDPAAGAIVDVTATGPGGAPAPVRAVRQEDDGVYAASVDVAEPGVWTLVVTSSFPPGTTEVPVAVRGAAGGTTTAPVAAGASSTTGPVLAAPEGGSDTTNLISAAVFGVVGGALGLWVSRRRSARRAAAEADRADAV